MFDSSSGGSRPNLEPSEVSRCEIALRPQRLPNEVATTMADDEEDHGADHDIDGTGRAQRNQLLATDHGPQYDSPGRGMGTRAPLFRCQDYEKHSKHLKPFIMQ